MGLKLQETFVIEDCVRVKIRPIMGLKFGELADAIKKSRELKSDL